uniref:Uncharacterized protein n=1 Tax=Araneus ventricosus TaxID=182803 RepID=A0A4Y2UZU0_ARAVE|nr:hypothetical protein AVEN_22389-1 [Araneus ventricosus]
MSGGEELSRFCSEMEGGGRRPLMTYLDSKAQNEEILTKIPIVDLQRDNVWSKTLDLVDNRPIFTVYLCRKWVSSLEPFGPAAGALPLGHFGPQVVN